jgi:hypothetical protein
MIIREALRVLFILIDSTDMWNEYFNGIIHYSDETYFTAGNDLCMLFNPISGKLYVRGYILQIFTGSFNEADQWCVLYQRLTARADRVRDKSLWPLSPPLLPQFFFKDKKKILRFTSVLLAADCDDTLNQKCRFSFNFNLLILLFQNFERLLVSQLLYLEAVVALNLNIIKGFTAIVFCVTS